MQSTKRKSYAEKNKDLKIHPVEDFHRDEIDTLFIIYNCKP